MGWMAKPYDPKDIEAKWQEWWRKHDTYRAEDFSDKPKAYILDMFPYPSGTGLHVGHPLGYIATDVLARHLAMRGHNVLHPMGWDAFGLPAENYAIKNKIHPRVAVAQNIAHFKEQLALFGFSYDWSREINTTDPEYYKWTQWIFLQLFDQGLAYEAKMPINWCPGCKTGLANEEVTAGVCERCSSKVEKRNIRQWMLKITEFADRLLDDLEDLEWPERIKEMQRNWIGRSEGAEVTFTIKGANSSVDLPVYTTRPDTLFGATYVVLSPEHALVKELLNNEEGITNKGEVEKYVEAAAAKSDVERQEGKEKTGVKIDGIVAINPVNKEELPVFVADYVLVHYGTGAIMAVPAHDERDFAFATAFDLPIRQVVSQDGQSAGELTEAIGNDGVLINSGDFTGMGTVEGKAKIIEWLVGSGSGEAQVNYKLRDWVFSRQRYWGEPIPVVHCDSCGVVAVPEDQLPVLLPDVESYEPTGTGESPLAEIADWVNTTCPTCDGAAKRETNTMPQWAGSCWYYLRYIDPNNTEVFVDPTKEAYWMPVDMYLGGAEHAVLHLLYARFWHKVLYDRGHVSTKEPFKKLFNQGMILGADHQKMSKSRGNVINPDEVVDQYGADAFRLYEMFMGPLNQEKPWDTKGIIGLFRFLKKVYALVQTEQIEETDEGARHRLIEKVTGDIQTFDANTAISAMMEFVNVRTKEGASKEDIETLTKLIAPFAPHLAEEIWQEVLGKEGSVYRAEWPTFDKAIATVATVTIAVQVNGKLRGTLELAKGTSEGEAVGRAKELSAVVASIGGNEITRTVFVPDRIVNFIV